MSDRLSLSRVPYWRGLNAFMAFMVLTLVGLWLTVGALLPITNPDTFFHLRFGQEFLDGWAPWAPDAPGINASAHWVPTQYVSQMVMAGVVNLFGMAGLTGLYGLTLLGVLAYTYGRLTSFVSPLPAALLSSTLIAGIGPWITPRPVLASFLLMGILTFMVVRAWDRNRVPWLALPLIYLWVLVHGTWIVGVGIVFALALAATLQPGMRGRAHWVLALAAAMLPAVTPVTYRIYGAVTTLNDRGARYTEWAPLDWTTLSGMAFLALLLAAACSTLLPRTRPDMLTFGLTAYAAVLGLLHGRGAAMGVAVLVFVLARSISRAGLSARPSAPLRVVGLVPLAVLALVVLVRAPATAEYDFFPPAVRAELMAMDPGTVVYSRDYYSAYVLYMAPQTDPYPHGQVDVYTDEEWERFGVLPGMEKGWDQVLEDAGVQYAVMPLDDPQYDGLISIGYEVVVKDRGWAVLASPAVG